MQAYTFLELLLDLLLFLLSLLLLRYYYYYTIIINAIITISIITDINRSGLTIKIRIKTRKIYINFFNYYYYHQGISNIISMLL